MNVADTLVHRLSEIGIRRLFTVPGDYTLALLDHFLPGPIQLVGTCNELNAAYAADGYARVNGVGALCVTYCVGGLSALNGVAGSYAERVPVVVVTGGPSREQRGQQRMVHHSAGAFTSQLEAYRPVTAAAVILDDPSRAAAQIDEVLAACLYEKRPVYLELPTDVLRLECGTAARFVMPKPPTDESALGAAVDAARERIQKAQRPVVLSGVEILRHHLEANVARLCRRAGLPFGAGLLGKSSVDETNDGFLGIYQGGVSGDEVKAAVEGSDALLILGGWLADSSTGGFSHGGDPANVIHANVGSVRIAGRIYEPIALDAFIDALADALPERPRPAKLASPPVYGTTPYAPEAGRALTMARFMDWLQGFLDEEMLLVAETGDALFWSADLKMPAVGAYVCQGYYLSIGFSVPAALGLSLAAPDKRVVVLVGDGAFQMTCQELSTIVRQGLRPIVFLLNNDGYAVERMIHDGPYNEIAAWRYHRITEMLGGKGHECRTEDELAAAVESAGKSNELSLIEVRIGRDDVSPTFRRLGQIIARRNVPGRA